MTKRTGGERLFAIFNAFSLLAIGLASVIPIWHCICCSISDLLELSAHRGLTFHPLGTPTLKGYEQCFKNSDLIRGYGNTVLYLITGTAFGLALTVLAGYGLSRKLMWSRPIALFITFTMMFNGGIIPTYMVVRNLGLLDTRLAVILPTAVSVFNIMVTRTSFAAIPESMLEAARIDGAGHFRILWSVVLPVSKSILAVVTLFYAIQIWNSWFHTAIYVTDRSLYPLQIILREIVLQNSGGSETGDPNEVNVIQVLIKYCVIMMSILPMMVLYPFIQKYFVSGVMIGSIKG
ncbi:carbohydrate ABC transporter permease [Acutalibacter sp. 1XD8-36]|uniref:carbohydrate ABC transporter permease n=1 Tax=Acutalibacter sp. 1XD8-36 TaxID=2320852 RepID=UPI002637C25C|nr:carbohydrate ABC transporter permease [Acutalibacter sp. 1XD8-36]